jgi:hypothetical protein
MIGGTGDKPGDYTTMNNTYPQSKIYIHFPTGPTAVWGGPRQKSHQITNCGDSEKTEGTPDRYPGRNQVHLEPFFTFTYCSPVSPMFMGDPRKGSLGPPNTFLQSTAFLPNDVPRLKWVPNGYPSVLYLYPIIPIFHCLFLRNLSMESSKTVQGDLADPRLSGDPVRNL